MLTLLDINSFFIPSKKRTSSSFNAFDIADWFEVKGKIEKVADPLKWHLEKDEKLVYVPVNLTNFYKKYGKTVRKNISVPEYLANWAKENKINVSRVASDALKALQEQRA